VRAHFWTPHPRRERGTISRSTAVLALVLVLAVGLLGSATPGAAAAPGWATAEPIDWQQTDASAPHVATNPTGTTMVVWEQDEGSTRNIWANRHVAGVGWGTPTIIDRDTGYASGAFVGIDGQGDAIAVWLQYVGGVRNVVANRYEPASGWGTPAVVDDTPNEMFGLDFAMSRTGHAVAAWHDLGVPGLAIYATRYTPGTGWDTPTLLETSTVQASYPAVAVDRGGNATAAWQQGGALLGSRYAVSLGWGSPQQIDPGDIGSDLGIAMDDAGNAIAVWNRVNSTFRTSLFASRYVVGVGWGTPVALEAGTGDTLDPQIAITPSGDAVVVWRQAGTTVRDIRANTYTVGGGWGTETLLAAQESTEPEVAVSPDGTATAVWSQMDGIRDNVWANRYVVGAGWGSAELIETENTGNAFNPEVAMDGQGNAIAVWQYQTGVRSSIWANRFTAPDETPPSLTLSSPADESTVDAPTVTVAGTTEPGADLVVNGVRPDVAADGTFSFPLALAEGANVITARARDAAGNEAVATRTVTYVNPVDALRDDLAESEGKVSQANANLDQLRGMVLVLFALIGAVLVALLWLYARLRRALAGAPAAPPPPPT